MGKRNIVIVEVKPPIPTHAYDFCAYLEGAEETGAFGWGATEEDAKTDLSFLVEYLFYEEDEEEETEEEEDAKVEE